MAYDVQNLANNKPGETAEVSARTAQGGLYRHPEAIDKETGELAEVICIDDPLFGSTQAESMIRLGFERVGDAPEGSIKTIVEQSAVSKTFNTDTVDVDAKIRDAMELENFRREKREKEEAEAAEADKKAAEEKEAAEKAEAEAKAKAENDAKLKAEADKKAADAKKVEGK